MPQRIPAAPAAKQPTKAAIKREAVPCPRVVKEELPAQNHIEEETPADFDVDEPMAEAGENG